MASISVAIKLEAMTRSVPKALSTSGEEKFPGVARTIQIEYLKHICVCPPIKHAHSSTQVNRPLKRAGQVFNCRHGSLNTADRKHIQVAITKKRNQNYVALACGGISCGTCSTSLPRVYCNVRNMIQAFMSSHIGSMTQAC